MKRIVFADNHPSIAQGFSLALKAAGICETVEFATTGMAAIEACERHKPDLLLAHLRLPDLDAVAVQQRLKDLKLKIPVVIYTAASSELMLRRALAAGPAGMLHKEDDLSELREVVLQVLAGNRSFSKRLVALLTKYLGEALPGEDVPPSELDVLKLVAEGWTTTRIAETLKRAPDTVKHQRENLLRRFAVHDTPSLLRVAREIGLIE